MAPPALDEFLIRQFDAATPALLDRWVERAEACSIKVHRSPPDVAAVQAAINDCLMPHAVTRCILNAHEFEESLGLRAYLAGRGIAIVQWGEPHCREASFSCEASITDCRAGLADTGGILVWSDASFGRSSTLVIPIHLVLLPVSRILPDLVDGLRLAHSQKAFPSNIVVINGPSKTADIEMNLITGVHGPKFLHVILINDRP
jgi:L-lactate dehydrogenase complex protein LldG